MSRYLALVLLALSASVLAAPAELPSTPAIPDTTTVTRPILGERSNGKVYSPNTLHKRDLEYPTSTQDCQVPQGSTTRSYTREGQQYSEDCLSRLALSVPFENRQSCRNTGAEARGYDEECLFKKAFDEDWKFDLEKAKEEELAYRSNNPSVASSDAWRTSFPTKVSDCVVVVKVKVIVAGEEKEKESDWSPYSLTPDGKTLDNECMARLALAAGITLTAETCPSLEIPIRDIALAADLAASVGDLAAVAVDLNVLLALSTGCLLEAILRIVARLGLDVQIANDPLGTVVRLITGLLATLLRG